MKKTFAICLIILLCAMIIGTVNAEGGTWTCPTCGEKYPADYSFCPNDATEKPVTATNTTGSASGWTKRTLTGTSVTIKPYPNDPQKEKRRQAYLGPDKNKYPGGGSYRASMVNDATAILREGDYVLVDLRYHETEKRVVYFRSDSLEQVPVDLEITSLTGSPATTCEAVVAMMGPGEDYEVLEITEKSKYKDWSVEELAARFGGSVEITRALQNHRYAVVVEEGTPISVFFECDGYVFTEFSTAIGNVRAWLPVDAAQ